MESDWKFPSADDTNTLKRLVSTLRRLQLDPILDDSFDGVDESSLPHFIHGVFFNKTRAGPSSCSFSLLIGESFAINDFCSAVDALAVNFEGLHFSSGSDNGTVKRLIHTLRRLGLDPLLDTKFEDVNDLAVANYIFGVHYAKKTNCTPPLPLKLRWQIEKNIIDYFCDVIEAEEESFVGISSFAWEGKEVQITDNDFEPIVEQAVKYRQCSCFKEFGRDMNGAIKHNSCSDK